MLRLLIELVIVALVSVTAFALLPLTVQGYIMIGAIVMIVFLLMIYSVAGFNDNDEHAPTPVWLFSTVAACALLGVLWPAVPMIIVGKYVAARHACPNPEVSSDLPGPLPERRRSEATRRST